MAPLLKCNKCGEKQPEEEYYRNYTGYRIKICKECYIKIRKKRQKEIARRKKAFKLW